MCMEDLRGFFFSPHSSSSAHLIPILFQPVWNDGANPRSGGPRGVVCGEGCFSLFYAQLFFFSSPSRSLSLSPSPFAYNGLSLPWPDTIHDYGREGGGGGGCAQERRRLPAVSCSRFFFFFCVNRFGAPRKLGSCKGRDAKIECLFMRLAGGKRRNESWVGPVRCASGSSPQNLLRTRFNALWADKRVLRLIGLLSWCNGSLRGTFSRRWRMCVCDL